MTAIRGKKAIDKNLIKIYEHRQKLLATNMCAGREMFGEKL